MEEKRLKNLRKIRVPLAAAVLLCFVSAGASLGAERLLCGWKTSAVETKLREIDRLVSEKYIGETDSGSVADYAAVGYVTGLGDKWSSYIPADQYEAYRMSSDCLLYTSDAADEEDRGDIGGRRTREKKRK